MKSLQFTLYVSVPDNYDENTLVRKVRDFVDGLHSNLTDGKQQRLEAKASFAYSGPYGFDPVDEIEWRRQACEGAGKTDPTDTYGDTRAL